jgi:hypothetical protein
MRATTHEVTFGGAFLQRGFWLYVWEVKPPRGRRLYYVGRTGDASSCNAQSPFTRMGQHLGFAENSSMLRRHLQDHRVEPRGCLFRLVAHGPIIEEAEDMDGHLERRDVVAAMEKALAEAMSTAGYSVMNTVNCRKPFDRRRFARVRRAFAAEFPKLRTSHEPYRSQR